MSGTAEGWSEQVGDESGEGKPLPAANEFSPGQVDPRRLLELIAAHPGRRDDAIEAVRREFFADAAEKQRDPAKRLRQQRTRAYNAILGASKYGLVDLADVKLTALGRELVESSTDDAFRARLARHIIRQLHGLDVLQAVRGMRERGDPINKTSLQEELEQRYGFRKLPRATLHHMRLLSWLRGTGVLPESGYDVDAEAVERIAGVSLDDAEEWAALRPDQRAFLRMLRRVALVHGSEPVPARTIVDAVVDENGPIFKRPDQLSASLFRPLTAEGWISHSVAGSGRGGKSGVVAATERLLALEVDLLPEGDGLGIPPDLRERLRTPLDAIARDLESDDSYTKGIALELLAVRMAIDLTLVPIRFRERGASTGGAEVDLVAEAAHLLFSRWLIQCKNTAKVGVPAIAKEVGMATLLKAHVVVVVTTGSFTPSVEAYARELTRTTPLQAALVDGKLLTRYMAGGGDVLREFFNDQARATLAAKRPQVAVDDQAS